LRSATARKRHPKKTERKPGWGRKAISARPKKERPGLFERREANKYLEGKSSSVKLEGKLTGRKKEKEEKNFESLMSAKKGKNRADWEKVEKEEVDSGGKNKKGRGLNRGSRTMIEESSTPIGDEYKGRVLPAKERRKSGENKRRDQLSNY